jgi:putative membrane protein
MTLFMLATQPFLPKGERYDLPPELIMKELAHRAHMLQHLQKKQIVGATLVSHFGYGAAMGALYTPLGHRRLLSAPVQGGLFGLLVWALSYLCLLPLLGMSESGHREPGRRNLMMIAAHLVWGAALGSAVAALTTQERGAAEN